MATTKVQVVLDIEYDLPPSRYNKIEIQKILAIMCHEIQRDNLMTWQDVGIEKFRYKINLNPYIKNYQKNNNSKYNNKRTSAMNNTSHNDNNNSNRRNN